MSQYTPDEQVTLARIARDVRKKDTGVLKRYLKVNGTGGFSNNAKPIHLEAVKLHRDELARRALKGAV